MARMVSTQWGAGREAARLEAEMAASGTAERAVKEKAYLKSELRFLGASMSAVNRAMATYARAHRDLTHEQLIALAEALWAPPVHERRAAAVELLTRYAALLEPADVALLERLLRESLTWALVDGLAASVVSELVERYPLELAPVLDRWAADEDFWIRRSAMLALMPALRRGVGDFPRFARYADAMLDEREFFIRKAIGWVLRETSKKRPELVRDWLRPRVSRASTVTFREAVKYLQAEDREALTELRKTSNPPARPRSGR